MSFLIDSDIQKIYNGIEDLVPKLAGKNILITGSQGFLGKYFSQVFYCLNDKVLANNPCKVVCLDNYIVPSDKYEDPKSFADGNEHYKHDITKPFLNKYNNKFDYIINAAGIASPYHYNKLQLETLDVSVDGLKNMLALSVYNNARLLYFSSSEVYGTPPDDKVPTNEEYIGAIKTTGKRAIYDITKLLGQTLCDVYNELGADAVIVRPFNFTGPGMSKNDNRVFPNFINKILNNKEILINGTGKQTRTFCYITDAIIGCFKVLLDGEKGEAYNIGNSNNEISMIDLVDRMEKVIGQKVKRRLVPAPINYLNEPMRRCPDITKAKEKLGYEPKVELDEMIYSFYEWAKENYQEVK